MTGYYVRIQRDGKWQALDIATLTDEELERLEKPPEKGWPWAIALARWIRDNVKSAPVDEGENQ
jgi:hypothetical protein